MAEKSQGEEEVVPEASPGEDEKVEKSPKKTR